MKKLIPLFILSALWSSVHIVASPAGKQKLVHYDERVMLTGTVVSRTFYGPPNYGENPKTDSKESQYILLLDSAIDVIASKDDPNMNETEHSVKKVTLIVFDFKAHPVKALLGRRVEVEGKLFHATTGHHHTKVLIEVSDIKKAR